jgi:outer membrane cobalamin receptor
LRPHVAQTQHAASAAPRAPRGRPQAPPDGQRAATNPEGAAWNAAASEPATPTGAPATPAADDLDPLLAAEDARLATLVVTGRRTEQAEDGAVERMLVLRRDELERGGVRDLGEALEEQPGVRVLRGVRGTSVEMMGLGPTYALVLVDGDRVPGRSNGAIDLGDHVVLRASHGWGFRAPSFQELLLRFENTSAGYVVDGNPNLGPETSRGTMASVEWRPTAAVRLGLGAYHNDVDGLITAAPTSMGPGGTVFSYVNVARATTLGGDLTVSMQPWRPLELRASYALLGTRDVGRDRPLDGRPVHRGTVTLQFDEPRTRLSAAVRAAIGGTRTYFTTGEDGRTVRATAPATVQLDARAGWWVTRGVEVHVGVDNALDVRDGFLALMPRTVYAGLRLRHPESRPASVDAPARAPLANGRSGRGDSAATARASDRPAADAPSPEELP